MTLRDEVVNESLEKLIEDGQFRRTDLPFNATEQQTVRRVLANLEELGWLTRENESEPVWKPGERVHEL